MRELSVIVPTFNRAKQLDRLLTWLSAQTIDREISELILVNDGSKDDTESVLNAWKERLGSWLLPLHQSNQGQSKARAHAVEKSRGQVLLFLDDDMEPRDVHFLSRHLEFHRGTSRPSVALGAILKPPHNPRRPAFEYFYERSIDRMYEGFLRGEVRPSGEHFFSANVSLPKSLYQISGGFDPRYRHAEDRELGLRLAYKHQAEFRFLPEAAAFHHSLTGRFQAFVARAAAYGHYDWLMAKEHPDFPIPSPDRMLRDPNPVKRLIAQTSYRWPALAPWMNRLLIPMAELSHALGLTPVAIQICSVLYCCNYMSSLGQTIAEGGQR